MKPFDAMNLRWAIEDVVLEAISRWNSEIEEEKKNKGE